MEKIGVLIKQALSNRVRDSLKHSNSIFVIKYERLSSPDLTTLRQALKNTKATLFVTKNSVAIRSLSDSNFQAISKYIQGSCGLVFAKDDPVTTCRALYEFLRAHEQLKVEGAIIEDRLFESKELEALSKLPTKEVLRMQLVMTLKSPIRGFAAVLKQTLRKFVYCLDQVKTKKEKE
ncbi:MAG: 50S ribosomal protein L10, partial [Candidatus Omnitrophota bacterium]